VRWCHRRAPDARVPPETSQGIEVTGTLKAVRYVSKCTRAEDHLLVAGDAPEISVLADYEDSNEAFVTDYPMLWDYVSTHYYRDYRAGMISVDDEPQFIVFADTARPPSGRDDTLGLPCFR
jgi:hypothetical protein